MSEVRGNTYRSLTLYLIKKYTPLKLTEIGELFAMVYSAISQAVKRFEQKCKIDKEIERIKDKNLDALQSS